MLQLTRGPTASRRHFELLHMQEKFVGYLNNPGSIPSYGRVLSIISSIWGFSFFKFMVFSCPKGASKYPRSECCLAILSPLKFNCSAYHSALKGQSSLELVIKIASTKTLGDTYVNETNKRFYKRYYNVQHLRDNKLKEFKLKYIGFSQPSCWSRLKAHF